MEKPDFTDAEFTVAEPAPTQLQISQKVVWGFAIFLGVNMLAIGYAADEPWMRLLVVVLTWSIWPLVAFVRTIGQSVSEEEAEALRSRILRGGR